MRHSSFLRQFFLACFFLVLSALPGHGQGIPWYTIPLPVPNGLVDAATGNLHLEIPLGSMPQRNGDAIVSKLIYDTTYYSYTAGSWVTWGPGWVTILGNSHSGINGAVGSGESCTQYGLTGYPNGSVTFMGGFSFTDIHGTAHAMPNGPGYQTRQVSCYDNFGHPFGNSQDITSVSGGDQDGFGYTFTVSNYNQWITVSPDGTILFDNTSDAYHGDGFPLDSNGNMSRNRGQSGQGSQPNLSSGLPSFEGNQCGNTSPSTYTLTSTVKASDGSSATYTMTCTVQNISNVVNGTTYIGTVAFLTNLALPDGSSYSFTYDVGSTGTHNGILLSFTLPKGGTGSFTYGAPGGTGPIQKVQTATFGGGTWNLSLAPGSPTSTQTTTTVTGPTRYDSGSGTNVNDKAVFVTNYAPLQAPYLQTAQYYSGSSTLLKTVTYNAALPTTITTTLNDTGQSYSVYYQYFVGKRGYPTQVQETDFTGTIVRTTKTTYNSTFMKPTTVNIYAGSGTGSPIASTLYTYDEYSANYCKNGVPMLASFTGAYGHDDTNFGTGFTARGNVTTIQRLISGTTYSTTHMCYDTLGNVTQSVDANGNPMSFDYSENWTDTNCIPSGTVTHAFPTTITDALGHRTKNSYFSCTVLAQSTKDENDIQATRAGTTFTYDALERPLVTTYPDGGQTSISYPNATTISTTKAMGGQNLQTTTILDNLGRQSQAQLNSDPQGAVFVDTTYDALGHQSTVSNPYRSTSDPTYGISTARYDALGRVNRLVPPDGSQTTNNIPTSYLGNCTTVTDQAGKARKSCTDALGRIIQVFEDPSGLNYETDYAYDALDNLLCVGQKGTNTGTFSGCSSIPASWVPRTFVYDSLSRLTSATNPESGTITYKYDSDTNCASPNSFTGLLVSKTDARGIRTCIQYDALNRITQKNYSDGTTPAASFVYDLASIDGYNLSNTVGRLVRASTTGSYPTGAYYNYDSMGRIINRGECVLTSTNNCGGSNPTLWTTSNSYDLAGDPITYTDANGVTFTQTFDAAGRPSQLSSSWNDPTHPATLFTVDPTAGYTPGGAIKKATLGNGLMETAAYNNRLQPCRMNWNSSNTALAQCTDPVPPTGNVLDFNYNFVDPSGHNNSNLASWTAVGLQTFTRSFGYDSLNRIFTMSQSSGTTCGSNGSSVFSLSWTIDPWGNRTDQNVTSGTCNAFHQPVGGNNRFTSGSYDSAGNLLCDGTHCYTYDAENRIYYVDSGNTAFYVYDADGRRVARRAGSVVTYYVYGADGQVVSERDGSNNWYQTYFSFGGLPLGLYRGSSTGFLHRDHLGSTRLVTLSDKSVNDNMDYLPFGEQIAGGNGTTHQFTGKERDSESGLDNFGARYNSSSLGRFMSPDWSPMPQAVPFADFSNPQSLNLYTYVWNNPLAAIDPDGHDCSAWINNNLFEGTALGGPVEGDGCVPQGTFPPPDLGPTNPMLTGGCSAEYERCITLSDGNMIAMTSSTAGYIFFTAPFEDSASGIGYYYLPITVKYGPSGEPHPTPAGAGSSNRDLAQFYGCLATANANATAIGMDSAKKSDAAMKQVVPSFDWAGVFTVGSVLRQALKGGVTPVTFAEGAGIGIMAKALYFTGKATAITLSGDMKANFQGIGCFNIRTTTGN